MNGGEKVNVELMQHTDNIRNRPEDLDTYTPSPSSKARKSADDLQDVLMKRIANAQAGRDF